MTPKAPADIDKWMIDVPAANTSNSVLAVRTIKPSHVPQLNETLSIPTPRTQQLLSRKVLYAKAFAYGCCILTLLVFIQRPPDALLQHLSRLDRHNKMLFGIEVFTRIGEFLQSRMGRRMLYFIKSVLVGLLMFNIYMTALLWNSQYLLESWSATSDFLETCKMQKV
jgi:hypothetical protein